MDCQRHLFDIPMDVAYLDCAFMGPLMGKVMAAGRGGLSRKARPWELGTDDFFGDGLRIKALMARLMNARAEDFALIPSVSYGMAVVAKNLPVSAGSEILVMARQFPSNVYVWRDKARANNAHVTTLGRPEGQSWTEVVLDAIGPQTSIVALAHVHWIDGGLLDLEAIGQKARQHGAALVLDLTQSLGALPFNARAVDADFTVMANYKWLLGPYGTGFLHVAERHHGGLPLEQCWQSRDGAENFAGLTDYHDHMAEGAARFDMGERSNFALLPAVEAALTQILGWGVENICDQTRTHTAQLAQIAGELGLHSEDEPIRAPHYLSLRLPNTVPDDLQERLRAHNVFVSRRGDRLRVTPHVWVNEADIERFGAALKASL
jgi:selenocysteine lyase/cysteine desulfurase